jgi:hypothetical protein
MPDLSGDWDRVRSQLILPYFHARTELSATIRGLEVDGSREASGAMTARL